MRVKVCRELLVPNGGNMIRFETSAIQIYYGQNKQQQFSCLKVAHFANKITAPCVVVLILLYQSGSMTMTHELERNIVLPA